MAEILQAPPEGYDPVTGRKKERRELTDPEFLKFQYWFVNEMKIKGEVWVEEYAQILKDIFEYDWQFWEEVKSNALPNGAYTDEIYDEVAVRLLHEKMGTWDNRLAA